MTVVSRTERGGQGFALIDRFGVWGGQLAHLRVTLPLLAHAPTSWYETTIAQVNRVIGSLSMDGNSASKSELVIEDGSLGLRSINPNRPLKSPFSFETRRILLNGSTPSE
jgi:hypothetical protein